MPLITCPDCARQVSDSAPACPGCGRPFQVAQMMQPQGYGPPSGYGRPPQPAAEVVLFQDPTVTVTNMRAILPGVTYAMANITSVREFVEPRPVALVILGFMLLALSALCVSADIGRDLGIFVGFTGAVLLAIFVLLKPKHWVRIGTAGAETNAICSAQAQWTRTVVAAINQAMVARG